MDFVAGLPRTQPGFDTIWVIVDRLTKSAHFLPIRANYSMEKLAKLYIHEIVRLHGTPVSIVLDRDPRFTSRFWGAFQNAFGTKLSLSTAYHPQTDGQSERTIQTLEDMLRSYVLEEGGDWSQALPLIEFSYNNSFHASIGMAPYEALYGRKCRSPLCWVEVGEKAMLGPDLVQETTDKVKLVKEKLRVAQSRQKSYADKRRKPLEFQEGEHVFLKVTATTGVGKAVRAKKLHSRYLGPFQILQRVGPVAYRLALPPILSRIHNVFHVSQLRKYIFDPSHILNPDDVSLRSDLTHRAEPVRIVDSSLKVLRNKAVPLVKVVWKSFNSTEATWEREQDMKDQYPELFP